jgi:hypothetical protein
MGVRDVTSGRIGTLEIPLDVEKQPVAGSQ